VRYGVTFWTGRDDGAVLLRRRPEEGLLGGMMEFPGTPWVDADWDLGSAEPHAPVAAAWQPLSGRVVHGFTHFQLELTVLKGEAESSHEDGIWVRPRDFGQYALPTVMKKVARHVLG
jgi:A/G-specific adenine glycosylase